MNHEELMARLNELAEPEYAAFSSALVPGCRPMLGVRIPALRRLAKELARTPEESLAMLTSATFEEGMLRGLVCACAKGDAAARKARLTALLRPETDAISNDARLCFAAVRQDYEQTLCAIRAYLTEPDA